MYDQYKLQRPSNALTLATMIRQAIYTNPASVPSFMRAPGKTPTIWQSFTTSKVLQQNPHAHVFTAINHKQSSFAKHIHN